jgi:MFS family permease
MSNSSSHPPKLTTEDISEPPWPRPSQAWVTLSAFCIAAILSYTDRQILSLLVDPLRLTFQLSDTQVSVLQGVAFALIYAFAGLPLGRMADVLPRRRVIIGGILIWSVATLWCGLARSFGELFLARSFVGIGEAALAPAATSMIADLFPPRRRGAATGVFLMGQVAGGGLAITLGGAILQLAQSGALAGLPLVGGLAPWRATLLVLAAPGIVVALLIAATREPPRRHAPHRSRTLPLGDVARTLWAQRTTLGPLYLGMALLSVGDFSLQNWFPALLSRKFHLSPGLIGAELGPAAIAGALIGSLGAGILSDRRVAGGGVAARLPIAAAAAALAVGGALVMLAPSAGVAIAIFMCWLVMSNAAGAVGITAVQELAPPLARGVGLALISFFNIGVGLGIGTTMTAVLTDSVFPGPGGVGYSMTAMALPAAVLGALAFLAAGRGARRVAGGAPA